jgi:nucleoside-diphosphate-sugar epimerase
MVFEYGEPDYEGRGDKIKFKKIFVTGGAGYVGSALVPALLEKGYEVVSYDLYIYGNVLKEHPNLTEVKGDIRDKDKIIETSKDCDAFIHLACISNDPSFELNPELGKSINFDAFENIIEAAKANGIKRLIVASSTSQYGIKPADIDVTEETEAEPITDYAKFKIECEKLLRNTDMGNTEYVFVRPATLCGYALRLRLDLSVNILTINALINKKIKIFGGSQMRPALNMKDMVRFYVLLLEASGEKVNKQAFNISYQNITIMDLAKMIKEVIGDESIEFEVTPTDDKRSYHINSDKMKRVLGFECKFDLREAIRSIIDAYNNRVIKDGLSNPMYHNIERMKEIDLK